MGVGKHERAARALTLVYLPELFSLVAELEKPVPRIMALAATGTFEVTGPIRALAIVLRRYRKRGAAAAGDEIHLQIRIEGD
jgi:hypothetical protein